MRFLARSCIALFVCLAIVGCGYTIATTPLSTEYQTIAVPAFKNETFEEDLQIRFNNILVRELEADGRFRVVDDPAMADLILSGVLTDFVPRAISYVEEDDIAQFKITILASAMLRDAREDRVIWQQNNLWGTDFYQTRGGRTRERAIDEAIENLVERIIYESFDNYW